MGGQIEMEIKNIIKKLRKHAIMDYEIIPTFEGCEIVRVSYKNIYELESIRDLFKRGVKIEINSYTKTVNLWNIKEWERSRELGENIAVLVSLFYVEIGAGKTPAEAKQTQHDYAKTNNMLAAFYMIYK